MTPAMLACGCLSKTETRETDSGIRLNPLFSVLLNLSATIAA